MSMAKVPRELLDDLARKLIDAGKLIEAGWIGLRLAAVDEDASEKQLDEMRFAFFAGAQHLLGCLMGVMDEGTEPTEADLRRMSNVQKELDEFVEEMKRRIQ